MKLYARPQTKQRPRLGKRRKAYTPKPTHDYERQVKEAWIEQEGYTQFAGPVGMSVVIRQDHVEIEVWELEESHRPKGIRGDIDNYLKCISDGLNGAAYLDDRQVHYIDLRFEKDEEPDAEG